MNLKKIFRGYNLMGNKITNVRVDTPTQGDHPTTKDYLDETQKYDTATAIAQQNSPVMPWLKQVQNVALKPLLDKIIFPVVPAIYTNPDFSYVKVTVLGEYYAVSEKHLLILSAPKTMRVDYIITPGDRISGVVASVVVTKNDGSTQSFSSLTTSDTVGLVNFTFDFENIQKIELTKVFNPTTLNKTDNYGNLSKPSAFTQQYVLKYDLWALIQEKNIVVSPIFNKLVNNEADYSTGLVDNMASTDLIGYAVDKRLYIRTGSNIFSILVPQDIYDNYTAYAILPVGSPLEIDKSMFIPTGNDIKTLHITYFGSVIPYVCCTFDFGYFAAQSTLDIQFVKNN